MGVLSGCWDFVTSAFYLGSPLAIVLLILAGVPALDDLRGVKPCLDRTYSIPCECFGLLGMRMSLCHGSANAYRSIGQLNGA